MFGTGENKTYLPLHKFHISRAHAATRDVVTLLDRDYQRSDPLMNKWHRDSGVLVPDMCLNPLPLHCFDKLYIMLLGMK